MVKIKLPFEVCCQTLTAVASDSKLRAGNKNYFYITIEPSEEWLTVDSTYAIFKRDNLVIQRELTKIDNTFECQIPNEMMEEKGIFTVGIGGGDALLSNDVYVWVEMGCGYVDKDETSAILGNATLGLLVLGNGE